ncbi:MAG TPA: chemotaxis protein CheW [Candidatus Binatia bacterium]|jgi:purine-binding chemotaxis protein CheW
MKDDFTLLTFALEPVWYAISIRDVQEVVPLPELTPLADAPPFVSGMFNLRGKVVTAIDLRQRMGLTRRPWDRKTAVLVTPFEQKLFGLVVDQALSLIHIAAANMEPAPDLSAFLGGLQQQFIVGVGKAEGRLIPILNPQRIFSVIEAQELGDWQTKPADG